MQQAPGGTPAGYCPFCGAPVGVAGARFCGVCGRDMLTGAPNAGQAPQAVYAAPVAPMPSSYAPPPPGYSQPQPTAYSPAPAAPYAPVAYAPQPGMMAAMMGRPTVSAGQLIGVGLGLLGAMIVVVYVAGMNALEQFYNANFFAYSAYFHFPLPLGVFYNFADKLAIYVYAAVAVYLYATRRLATVAWGRALAEALALMAPLAVAYLGVYNLVFPQSIVTRAPSTALWLFVEFAVVALIGALFANWSAPWSSVRAQLSPHAAGDTGFTLILFVIVAALMNWPEIALNYAYTCESSFSCNGQNLLNTLALVDLASLIALVIIGAALAAGRLNRLLAQSASPSWSPSPTPQGAPAWSPPAAPVPPPAPPVPPPPAPPGGIDPDR